MAEKPVVASGAEYESAARRRNVGPPATNTLVVDKVEVDNKKEQIKKVCFHTSNPKACVAACVADIIPPVERTELPGIPRRVGVHHRTCNLYDTCLFH